MNIMDLHMTELERDVVREILNIGLARAADSFAVIAQEKVLLEVPSLDLVPGTGILDRVRDIQHNHVPVQSDIRGEFNGTTLMFFSGMHIQRLSKVCLRMNTSAGANCSARTSTSPFDYLPTSPLMKAVRSGSRTCG